MKPIIPPRSALLPVVLLLLAPALAPSAAFAGDWYQWRGPEQNGVSRERDLPEKFSLDASDAGSNLVFTANYGSIATPIVQGGQVYFLSKVGEGPTQQERILALHADTGKLLWAKRFNVWHTDIV